MKRWRSSAWLALSLLAALATGDFVLTDDEVNPVLRELRAGHVEVTAIHNHLLHGAPPLTFMHFWARGEPGHVGAALRRALARAATHEG
jgi:hypothetical protein